MIMKLSERPEFDHAGRREVYEYVERNGTVGYEEAREALRMDPTEYGHQVAILKRDGIIEEPEDGQLRIAFEEEARAEEHEEDGIEYVIRQARQEDLTGLVGAMRRVVERGDYILAETVAELVDHEQVLLRHNDIGTRVFFVATVDDDVVGWAHVDRPEFDKLSHTAELTVGVLEEYRGHGIGSHLLVRGVGWAAANGLERIYNSVPATNEAAIEFLKDHDWAIEAIREDHYRIDGEYVDEVMMGLRL